MGTDKDIIGVETPVRVGVLFAVGGGIVMAAWWASGITSKLDNIAMNNAAFSIQLREYGVVQRQTEVKLVEFERIGSPALVPRIKQLEDALVRIESKVK